MRESSAGAAAQAMADGERRMAMIVATDEPVARVWSDGGGDLDSLTRRRADVSYFMDAARLAARAAMRAGDELDLHRQGA